MTEFKPGDRVKVEFEGVLVRKVHTATAHAWEIKVGSRISTVLVSEVECTLIEPEIVLPEIPGTIVQVDPTNSSGMRMVYECDGPDKWYLGANNEVHPTHRVEDRCRAYGYRVIPAATEEVENV